MTPWTSDPDDVLPDVKALAVEAIEAIGSWRPGGAGAAAAAARIEQLGQSGRLVEQAPSLLSSFPAATLQVLAAQYGGLLTDRASVLVVCRQWLAAPGEPLVSRGTTVDVRLHAAAPHWRLTALHPGNPGPPARPISELARSVLRETRIELAPAARADVLAGVVHDSALRAMLRLAATYRIEVSVVRSGHPRLVFGTTRVSDHTHGRAFDTVRLDGRMVVDRATPPELVSGYMRAPVAAGAYNVGGPRVPSPGGSAFFTDTAHQDHIHAAFRT